MRYETIYRIQDGDSDCTRMGMWTRILEHVSLMYMCTCVHVHTLRPTDLLDNSSSHVRSQQERNGSIGKFLLIGDLI